jgi:hypothetical protein
MATRAASVSEALPAPSSGQRSFGTRTTDSACPSAPRRYDLTRTGVARHRSGRTAEGSSDARLDRPRAGIAGSAAVTPGFSQATSRALGGTSVLIVVGVALDTMRQMESQMLERRHEGFLKS